MQIGTKGEDDIRNDVQVIYYALSVKKIGSKTLGFCTGAADFPGRFVSKKTSQPI
jgi:hypothetical protein